MKGASRGLEGGLRRASRGLEKGFKGASRGLQALLTFVPPRREGPFKPPLKGTFEGGGSDPAPHHFPYPSCLQCRSPSRRQLVERLSSMMAHHCGFSSEFIWMRPEPSGHGSAKTCKNTLLPGNCLRNLSCPFASTPYCPEPADQWCHQATDNSAADAASAKGLVHLLLCLHDISPL